jgi:hypothetical protein
MTPPIAPPPFPCRPRSRRLGSHPRRWTLPTKRPWLGARFHPAVRHASPRTHAADQPPHTASARSARDPSRFLQPPRDVTMAARPASAASPPGPQDRAVIFASARNQQSVAPRDEGPSGANWNRRTGRRPYPRVLLGLAERRVRSTRLEIAHGDVRRCAALCGQ